MKRKVLVASFTDAWIETTGPKVWWCPAYVASFTDAWIETLTKAQAEYTAESHLLQMRGLKRKLDLQLFFKRLSHLLQMRGLKLLLFLLHLHIIVASFTDAWIETFDSAPELGKEFSRIFYRCVDWNHKVRKGTLKKDKSHLLQMRGLKLSASTRNSGGTSSHLLQMRGLKPEKPSLNLRACLVASFTDAWIETVRTWERRMKNEVASFTDAWIETVNAF